MFSVAITAYNEFSDVRDYGRMLLRCVKAAHSNRYVDDVVIVDDCSGQLEKLSSLLSHFPNVSIYQNEKRLRVFGNKVEAILRAKNEWVITCDSDNTLDDRFFHVVASQNLQDDTWYCPSFAKPVFDFRPLVGLYDLEAYRTSKLRGHRFFGTVLNAGNQTVHRQNFSTLFSDHRGKIIPEGVPSYMPQDSGTKEHWQRVYNACDSILFNSIWLKAGNKINILAGLEYDHYCPSKSVGPHSNYTRAPAEKRILGDAILQDLLSN